jgi:hypothetical protein
MPAKPRWFSKIAEIRSLVESDFPAPWLDRCAIQELFGVGKRSAHGLMHWVGACRIGDAYALRREDLLEWLRALEQTPEVDHETRRRRRVEDFVANLRAHRGAHRILIAERSSSLAALADLPSTTILQRGELRIRFTHPEDLLRQLHALSQAIMHDFEGFSALAGGPEGSPAQKLTV